jgi:hypothetical protein
MGSHLVGLSAQLDSHLLKSSLRMLFRKSSDIQGLLNSVFRFHTGHCFCSIRRQEVMGMKRFLIMSILFVFVTVSCAGPNKVGWTKPNFRQDQFEKDREECIQTLNNNLYSYSQTSGVVDDCLAMKGYQYQPQSESSFDKKESADEKDAAKTVGKVLLTIGVIAVAVPLLVLCIGLGELPHARGTFKMNVPHR